MVIKELPYCCSNVCDAVPFGCLFHIATGAFNPYHDGQFVLFVLVPPENGLKESGSKPEKNIMFETFLPHGDRENIGT